LPNPEIIDNIDELKRQIDEKYNKIIPHNPPIYNFDW
jgi:hypothetical protein